MSKKKQCKGNEALNIKVCSCKIIFHIYINWNQNVPGASPIKVKSLIIIVLESTRTRDDADNPFFPRKVCGSD